MRKRTARAVAATVGGALVGAAAMFLLLARLGGTPPAPPPPAAAVPVGQPRQSPSPEPSLTPPASPQADTSVVRSEPLGVSFRLPEGYRVAEAINAEFGGRTSAEFTLTKATKAQEAEYLRVLQELKAQQAPAEAPIFAPGVTITLVDARASTAEDSDATLAKESETLTTAGGLTGQRYRRVEGLFPYDSTYLELSGERRIAVQMAYSSAEPRFDEAAYRAVLDSLKPL